MIVAKVPRIVFYERHGSVLLFVRPHSVPLGYASNLNTWKVATTKKTHTDIF